MNRTHCRRGHPMTPENVDIYTDPRGHTTRRCSTCRRDRQRQYAKTPDVLERKRIWNEIRRRREGQKARENLSRPVPQGPTEQINVPAEPFAGWLREYEAEFDGPRLRLAALIGLDEASIRRFVDGKHQTVHIDRVDRALVAAGQQHLLNDLYPPEEAAA